MKNTEKEKVAIKVATSDTDGEITQKQLANQLGVSQQVVSLWIKAITDKRDNKRDQLIYHLSLLGWTQQEVGDLVSVDRTLISKIMDVNFTKFSKIHTELSAKGYKVDEISKKLDCDDIPLLWSLSLKDQLDDAVKMVKFGCEPQLFNIWNFQSLDERLGSGFLV